jgi:hypothetical protein
LPDLSEQFDSLNELVVDFYPKKDQLDVNCKAFMPFRLKEAEELENDDKEDEEHLGLSFFGTRHQMYQKP